MLLTQVTRWALRQSRVASPSRCSRWMTSCLTRAWTAWTRWSAWRRCWPPPWVAWAEAVTASAMSAHPPSPPLPRPPPRPCPPETLSSPGYTSTRRIRTRSGPSCVLPSTDLAPTQSVSLTPKIVEIKVVKGVQFIVVSTFPR